MEEMVNIMINTITIVWLVDYIVNYVWTNTMLEENIFKSNLSAIVLIWIYISNLFVITFSLELLILGQK